MVDTTLKSSKINMTNSIYGKCMPFRELLTPFVISDVIPNSLKNYLSIYIENSRTKLDAEIRLIRNKCRLDDYFSVGNKDVTTNFISTSIIKLNNLVQPIIEDGSEIYDLLDRREFKDNDRKTIMIVIALELYKLVSSLLQVSRYMYENISSKYVYEADDEWLSYTSSNPVPFVTPCNYVKCNGKCINIMKPVNGIDTMIYPKVKKILSDKLIVPDLCDIVGSYMSPTFESPLRTLIYDLILDNEMNIDSLNII